MIIDDLFETRERPRDALGETAAADAPAPANVVEFGPVALSRLSEAHRRESTERRRLEEIAEANFAAQTQTHAAVLDLIGADGPESLCEVLDQLARERFGLATAVLAIEAAEAPAGWRTLVRGQVGLLLPDHAESRLGCLPTAAGLFGDLGPGIASAALARLSLGPMGMAGVLAFGSREDEGFTEDMGDDMVLFLARVIERLSDRWTWA